MGQQWGRGPMSPQLKRHALYEFSPMGGVFEIMVEIHSKIDRLSITYKTMSLGFIQERDNISSRFL